MVSKRWTTSNTAVFNIGYHLIWCSKYRRRFFSGNVADLLRECILTKCQELGVKAEAIEIMPDHVHLFIKCSPADAPHWIVQQIKGYASRRLKQQVPIFRTRLPCVWTRSYFCESVGCISEDTVKRYIENQKNV